MKYVLLIHDDEKLWSDMPAAERDAMMGEYFAFTRGIQESGHYVAGEALQPAATATNVRVRGGQIQAIDGPFAETREQLGGFYMVDAASLEEAVAIAARIPSARLGTIEVRPVVDFSAGERPHADAAAAAGA
jgi:hypothetical protein